MTSTAPHGLRLDTGGDQFLVSDEAPILIWIPTEPAMLGHQLEAVVDGQPLDLIESSAQTFLAWPWGPLSSTQEVQWRVRTVLGDGVSAWSQWQMFEVGLLNQDWVAAWISPLEDEDAGYGQRPAHVLGKVIDVPHDVVRARLYATALGVYEAFFNGGRVGSAELSPGSTSYDKTLYAQASEIAAEPGPCRLELVLSDGWYRGQVGAFRIPAGWGDTLAVRAELHFWLADGTHQVVATGPDWTSGRSQITRADLMGGQTTDYRVADDVGSAVQVAQVQPPKISWSPAPPVRKVLELDPIDVRQVTPETYVVDFGQNASGWIQLTNLGPAGTTTTIDYGEYVGPDGDLDTSHLDAVRPGEPPREFMQRDVVVSDGTADHFEPHHTVHGFRYARITRPWPLSAADVTMQVVHTDLQTTGTFECSDPQLNQLWDVARWSFLGNAVDIPTDCPTRERLGWTGDYQVFISTAVRMFDVLGFSRKWLNSVRDDQLDDGRIANFSPDGRRIKLNLDDQFAMMTGSAGWGDAIVEVPWQLYQAYGNAEVLAENYQAMTAWVEWALNNAATARHASRIERSAEPLPHERFIWDGSFHWGEWAEPKPKAADGSVVDTIQTNPMAWFMADKGEVGTAYLYRSVYTLAQISAVLERGELADHYRDLAAQILDAWRLEFLQPTGRTLADTQASYVRALSFGLLPPESREAAATRLVELVREADNHLTTGFLSTGDLLPVLADSGHAEVAFDLLNQRTSPSWLAMLERGATTIWEDWDGIDENGCAHDSLNHYSKGAVVRFLHSHVLGLRPAGEVGWRRFVIAPVTGPSLSWASGSMATPHGTIAVAWRSEAGKLSVSCDVPVGTTAALVLPGGSAIELEPGHHEIQE